MDLQYFFSVLWRRKWLLLTVMLIAAVLTFQVVSILPYQYKSMAVIETNILNDHNLNVLDDNPFVQQFQIESKFSQIIEQMKSRRILKLLSEELLYHDLSADGVSTIPFRLPENEDLSFSRQELEAFVTVLASSKDTISDFSLPKNNSVNFTDLAEAFEYDYESLANKLEINRVGESDYINVSFTSEKPELSLFAVEKFADEFINYYANEISNDESATVRQFRNEWEKKEKEHNRKKARLDKYRSENTIVDTEKQSGAIITQITELEKIKEEQRAKIASAKNSLRILNRNIERLGGGVEVETASGVFLNEDLDKISNQIKDLNSKWIRGGRKDKSLEKRIASLRKRRAEMAKTYANINILEEREEDEQLRNLLNKRIDTEIALKSAEEGYDSIKREIERLRREQKDMVVEDAEFQRLLQDWNIALDEMSEARRNYNQALLKADNTSSPLMVFEAPELADKPESKKRTILSAFAGVTAGVLTTFLLFLLTFFDRSYQSPRQFEKLSSLPTVGVINKINARELDLDALFMQPVQDSKLVEFKESIRRLRYDIEVSNANSFLFVSTKADEGKSFLMVTLAYALGLNHKRVLIMDTNFKNNSLSTLANVPVAYNPLLQTQQRLVTTNATAATWQGVDIMGNAGDSRSASEVLAGKDLRQILKNLELEYDYIFLEAAAMNQYADARELSVSVDKVVLVTSAENSISSTDKDSFEFLKGLGTKFMGTILNMVNTKNL